MCINKIKWLIIVVILFPVLCIASNTMTPTGFYYPVGSENLSISDCGKWLSVPPPKGCYDFTDPQGNPVYHTGVDMKAVKNTDVHSIADGKVIDHIGVTSAAFGVNNLALLIEHYSVERGKFLAVYGHVQISGAKTKGSPVHAGEVIGKIGSWPSGDHLHFGILSPGLTNAIDTGSYGRWKYAQYGKSVIRGGHSFYDNGFIDPIDFIVHHGPDNSLTRQSETIPSIITPASSHFLPKCWTGSIDARCDIDTYNSYLECTTENSSLCADTPSSWSALKSSGKGSDAAAGGDSGVSYNLNQDFSIVDPSTSAKLVAKNVMLQQSQVVNVRVQLQSAGGKVQNFMKAGKTTIETDFYIRLGSGSWTLYKREYTKSSNLGSGTHTETVSYTVPSGISEISFRVHVDAQDEVIESDEGDNWSKTETFSVTISGSANFTPENSLNYQQKAALSTVITNFLLDNQ